jgi:predicted amidohydrolase YtcJ
MMKGNDMKLYKNADVITMDPKMPEADAFLVFNDRFVSVGRLEAIGAQCPVPEETIDLAGKTVIPGFIETHNHLSYFALSLFMVDCSPFDNQSMQAVLSKIEAKAAASPPGDWVVGWGYDDTLFEGSRHLNKTDLDAASPAHPVLIMHASGHLSYANSRALEMAGVRRETPQPAGGTIEKDANGDPTGLLMEPAAQVLVAGLLPNPDATEFKAILPEAVARFNREGVTSAHDGAVGMIGQGVATYCAYGQLEAERRLNARVYLTTMHDFYENLLKAGLGRGFGSTYLRVGAVKMFQDGSIQGLTAAVNEGYSCRRDFRGALIMPQEEMNALVRRYQEKGLQIAVHANGDAAIESVLIAFEAAHKASPRADLRHMIIHCQMATEDHIARMKALGVVPSYFPNHVYYWGDRHEALFLGPERAARIDPLGSSVKAGLRFALHADTPVTPVAPLHSIHCAVNRLTRNGKVLGPQERISPYDALKAYTVDAAYCSFEEDLKGAISPGKLADFVVLSDNIFHVDSRKIKDVQVLKTFVGGRAVWEKDITPVDRSAGPLPERNRPESAKAAE